MRSSGPIKVALVGCGGVARRYRKTYAGLPNVQVVLTVDINEAEARQAGVDTGAPRHSASFEDALAAGIDAVVLSTPNDLHAEQAVAILDAGKHLLLQKPMARTVEECDRILAAANKNQRTLGVYMNLLDQPLFRDLRTIVQSGYLGTIGLISARLAHRGGLNWGGVESNWRASQSKTGGGSLVQLGVHYQHLIRWLLADRFIRVEAFIKNRACPHLEGDDLAMAHYELAGGAFAEIQTAWCVQEEHFSVMGTRGSFHYRDNRRMEFIGEGGPFNGEALHVGGGGEMEVVDPLLPPEWDDAQNPHNQHRSFFAALQEGRPPEVTGEDGREDVRGVRACYESAREARVVNL